MGRRLRSPGVGQRTRPARAWTAEGAPAGSADPGSFSEDVGAYVDDGRRIAHAGNTQSCRNIVHADDSGVRSRDLFEEQLPHLQVFQPPVMPQVHGQRMFDVVVWHVVPERKRWVDLTQAVVRTDGDGPWDWETVQQ